MIQRYLATLFIVSMLGLPAFAEMPAPLTPQAVAVLANKNSPQSQQLAKYYAQKRGIPGAQVCVVDIPMGETLSRADWTTKVRPAIRRWIGARKLQNKLACFVTTWDVPLKIGKQETPDLVTRRRKRLLDFERARRVARLLEIAEGFQRVGADNPKIESTNLDGSSELQAVADVLGAKIKEAEARIQQMPEGGTGRSEAIAALTRLSVEAAGLQVVVQNLVQTERAGQGNERSRAELQLGRGRLLGLNEGQNLMDGLPSGVEKDTNMLALMERATGLVGSIQWIDNQLDLLAKNETYASFDSELALVMESDYPLLRWQPNYLHYAFDKSPLRKIVRTLMVSRLEAPSLELTKKLIDTSVSVEQQGLRGKVYLDSRGVSKASDPPSQPGEVAEYDRAVMLAAEYLKQNTSLEVVVDDQATLFGEGACPDAALYCGWYSLSKYINSFQWKPGSVGYHMAPAEASTLRRADSQVWCKRMLEEGVTATLGPVNQPYWLAFPRPNEFLALLVSGKLPYVQCVYRTKATNSWNMTTVGDPLYNPFKNYKVVTSKEIPNAYKRLFGQTPSR